MDIEPIHILVTSVVCIPLLVITLMQFYRLNLCKFCRSNGFKEFNDIQVKSLPHKLFLTMLIPHKVNIFIGDQEIFIISSGWLAREITTFPLIIHKSRHSIQLAPTNNPKTVILQVQEFLTQYPTQITVTLLSSNTIERERLLTELRNWSS